MAKSEAGRPRAVVCLSGGMDSCVCAALAARDYEVYARPLQLRSADRSQGAAVGQEIARLSACESFSV